MYNHMPDLMSLKWQGVLSLLILAGAAQGPQYFATCFDLYIV